MTNYPLTWPSGWKRTPHHQRTEAHFGKQVEKGTAEYSYKRRDRLTIAEAVDRILDELRRMGVRDWMNPIVSTNIEPTLSGRPRSGAAQPNDPGVAVYWRHSRDQAHKVMAIDRHRRVEDNLAAIAATLAAMRAIERHGGAVILERAFQGFTALPAPKGWREVLSYSGQIPNTLEQAKANYRQLAKTAHPDAGGSHERMAELNEAMASAEEELAA